MKTDLGIYGDSKREQEEGRRFEMEREMKMDNAIFARIGTVDMDGFNGREHHPTRAHEGRVVRVVTVESFEDEESGLSCTDISFQIITGIVVDENGDDIPNEKVELVGFEIEKIGMSLDEMVK